VLAQRAATLSGSWTSPVSRHEMLLEHGVPTDLQRPPQIRPRLTSGFRLPNFFSGRRTRRYESEYIAKELRIEGGFP
jgi:hypothetical protein